jgi:hypothetical protein
MTQYNKISHHNNEWHVPPGRYSATITHVLSRSEEEVRVIFTIPVQKGVTEVKKAGKCYSAKHPRWIEKDLGSLLGRDGLRKLAADGVLELEQLNKLIGTQAVLDITNEDHGQDVPLTVISEILPYTPANLKMSNLGGPKFRMSFASPASGHAIAA